MQCGTAYKSVGQLVRKDRICASRIGRGTHRRKLIAVETVTPGTDSLWFEDNGKAQFGSHPLQPETSVASRHRERGLLDYKKRCKRVE